MLALNNGHSIPPIGLGTYKITGSDGVAAIKSAVELGYRLIDTAFVYTNEQVVGQALREIFSQGNGITREDVFVVSKLGPTFHRPEAVEKGCRLSLERLGLDYVDLYLMHTPVAARDSDDGNDRSEIDDEVTPLETWKALEECQRKGMVRSIGVSNFNEEQLMEIVTHGSIRPVVNQVECSIGFHQAELRKLCNREEILIMAYSPLGKPKPGKKHVFLDSSDLKKMAEKYGRSPAQISLRFLIEIGTIPIPKSSKTDRMKENLDVLSFKLEETDVQALESLVKQQRSMTLDWLKSSKHYPFNDQ
ncbi:AAEL015002-PA [Aedes aegypti]|uniref:AAEL015002-PA n=2 Tax=Aedes aegypti TaxID=7159 RepID=A0A1S4G3S8_AEDAE|nr:1,5-anhydro-D-fructose reductase [Aedes aegypti]EAT32765.1 AAEL015002-PA [Aedes aegypti]